MKKNVLFIFLTLFCTSSYSNDNVNSSAWTQEQLNSAPTYMPTLTKNQCEYKTLAFLQQCDSDNCLMLMGGVSGDCISEAKGSLADFCKTYESNFYESYCGEKVKNRKLCEYYKVGKSVHCKNQ